MARGSLLVVTDLDGTLLDEETYGYEPARPALAALARRGAGLVLASSKSRAEMERLAEELDPRPALIVENGGAVLLPGEGGGYEEVVLGTDRATLVRVLGEIAAECEVAVRGFSSLAPEELRRIAGLSLTASRRALDRAYDEPFLLEDEGRAIRLAAAAERRGLRVTRGGRFFHLTGACDKGRALGELLARRGDRPTPATVGLGDAPNDLPMFRAVDRPIVVPGRSGRPDAALAAALPHAELAPAPGPTGWNAAVLAVLAGERLPPVALRAGP